MDRQATFLLALGLLIGAAAVVSITGWILFVRDRRTGRKAATDAPADAPTDTPPDEVAAASGPDPSTT